MIQLAPTQIKVTLCEVLPDKEDLVLFFNARMDHDSRPEYWFLYPQPLLDPEDLKSIVEKHATQIEKVIYDKLRAIAH